MLVYSLYKTMMSNIPNAVKYVADEKKISFIFDPANTDYQTFKTQVLADEAQLQDAEGNLMTAEEAKAFVATLP